MRTSPGSWLVRWFNGVKPWSMISCDNWFDSAALTRQPKKMEIKVLLVMC